MHFVKIFSAMTGADVEGKIQDWLKEQDRRIEIVSVTQSESDRGGLHLTIIYRMTS